MNDIRFALRQLARSKGHTAVTVGTLGVGIGACVAIFSVVWGVLLNPLPLPEPDRLVVLRESFPPTLPDSSVAYGKYMDWRDQAKSFASMGALDGMSFNLGGAPSVHLRAARISASLLTTLGISPALGRNFLPADELPGDRDNAAILSHGLWQSRFGGRPQVLGEVIQLNGRPYQVVGVMPPNSSLPDRVQVFTPLALPEGARRYYAAHSLEVYARLAPGVSIVQAQGELAMIAARMARSHPAAKGWSVRVVSLNDTIVGPVRPALLALLFAAALLLLIACANVANLLLASATARQTEMALRAAIGASRARLVRQLLTETLLLALLGGALGLLLAKVGLDLLLSLAPETLPRALPIGLDGGVVSFALGLALVTGVGFGLVPALQISRLPLGGALKVGARGSSEGTRPRRLRGLLASGELAMALWLLAGAGLLIRSFIQLTEVDTGFDHRSVHVASVFLPRPAYTRGDQHVEFARRAMSAIQGIAGVETVAAAANVPFSTMHLTDMSVTTRSFVIPGRPPLAAADVPVSSFFTVTSDYFRALRIRILRGRAFEARDGASDPRVAIISESLARRFFPGEEALGKTINIGGPVPREIVGIAADVKVRNLDGESTLQTYQPFPQATDNDIVFIVRTDRTVPGLNEAIRTAIANVDPAIAIYDGLPLSTLVSASIARQRFAMTLFMVFSAVALLLAAVGIYGVMAYSVTQRRAELGIRMALGAQPSDVLRLVLRQGGLLIAGGLGAGLLGAALLTRLLERLVFQVDTFDPVTVIATATLLTLVAATACLIPAYRATQVSLSRALRD